MTISTTTIKNSYSGNDSTTSFSYTFKISSDSEMQVIIRSSTGTETVKSLTTHYTVSGAGNASGGTVTTTSGNTVATGETVNQMKKDPDKIAAIEKAISKKYGKEAIQNPKGNWNENKEKE